MSDPIHHGPNQVRLDTKADWPYWYTVIKTYAQVNNVWHLCDPDSPSRPQGMTKPVIPDRTFFLNEDDRECKLAAYATSMADYREERAAFASVTMKIIESIDGALLLMLSGIQPHPRDYLRLLTRKLMSGEWS
ncbi:hypothetical protein IWX49DRAFT_556831 [Phyllosticta citricarpa]|uniref:Uncharacterized protein n=2 Tax=Phyllosticta TaxID=121621 RepID=A0ABR1LIA7_9PEZI